MFSLNPFIMNVFSYPYQLDEFIYNFRVVGWYFFFQILKETSVRNQWLLGGKFQFIQILKAHFVSKSVKPDQTPRAVASDLGFHCLLMSHKKEPMLKLVNYHLKRMLWVLK